MSKRRSSNTKDRGPSCIDEHARRGSTGNRKFSKRSWPVHDVIGENQISHAEWVPPCTQPRASHNHGPCNNPTPCHGTTSSIPCLEPCNTTDAPINSLFCYRHFEGCSTQKLETGLENNHDGRGMKRSFSNSLHEHASDSAPWPNNATCLPDEDVRSGMNDTTGCDSLHALDDLSKSKST